MGDRFEAELGVALEAIKHDPNTGILADAPFRMKMLKQFPYAVVFVELTRVTWIIAVHHDRQDSSYWQDRLQEITR